MSLTKVTYSMVANAPFNVLDYAGLAETISAKQPGNPTTHVATSFLCWDKPIKAALDACFAAGGGAVLLPKNTVPYYVTDVVEIKSNTTLICEDWIVLADYNLMGHTVDAAGDNITIQNLLIDNSGIYAGSSGYNGFVSTAGNHVKVIGGHIKNCARGGSGARDGGKGTQFEAGNCSDIIVSDVTFENCFMAMSTARDYLVLPTDPYKGIIYSNITAYDCEIFFYVRQSNGVQDITGLEHSVQITNFYARNCGSFEGVMQFSRASNVLVSNGIVVNETATTPLIRGNHANSQFVNIGFYANADIVIQPDASTYAVDNTYATQNNRYDIQVWGQVERLGHATVTRPSSALRNCFGTFQCNLDPSVAWFGNELRNGTSVFTLLQNNKSFITSTNMNYEGNPFGNPINFSGLSANLSTAQYHAVNLLSGLWNATSTTGGTALKLGAYSLWVDSSGRLRIKNGVPTSDTDGTVVGTQT